MFSRSLVIILFFTISNTALGYALVSHNSSRIFTGISYVESEHEPKNRNTDSYSIGGKLLFFGYEKNLTNSFSINASIGIATSMDYINTFKIEDGDGFKFSLNGQYNLPMGQKNTLFATMELTRADYEFEESNTKLVHNTAQLGFGGGLKHHLGSASIFCQFLLFGYDQGTLEIKSPTTAELNVTRKDKNELKIGADVMLTQAATLQTQILLMGEDSVVVGVGLKI